MSTIYNGLLSYHRTWNTIFKLLVELDDKNGYAHGISPWQWTDQGIYIFSNTARFKNMHYVCTQLAPSWNTIIHSLFFWAHSTLSRSQHPCKGKDHYLQMIYQKGAHLLSANKKSDNMLQSITYSYSIIMTTLSRIQIHFMISSAHFHIPINHWKVSSLSKEYPKGFLWRIWSLSKL
mgnify:CR=1 FL=1